MENKLKHVFLLIIILSASRGQEEPCSCSASNTEPRGIWTSPNYPDPYDLESTACCLLEYDINNCNGIFITIDDLDLNGKANDFLVIKSGTESMTSNDEGKIFTWSIDPNENPRKYLFLGEQIFMRFLGNDAADKYRGFQLTYECNDDVSTTEAPTTTTENPWPTPNSTDYLTVYLKRITATEFVHKLDIFLEKLINMANMYCQEEFRPAEGNCLPSPRVNFVKQCDYTLPDYDYCVEVTFAIALPKNVTVDEGYQLNRTHLSKMWSSFSKDSLDEMELQEYSIPDLHAQFIVWVLVICITLVIILLYLGVLWRNYEMTCTSGILKKKRRSEIEITEQDNKDFNDYHIGQHSLQTTPPLFDTEYTTYEPDKPDKGMPPTSYDYTLNDETDSDEDEILSLPPPLSPAIYFDNPNFESDL